MSQRQKHGGLKNVESLILFDFLEVLGMVKVKVEKTQVFVPDRELPFYPYSHDIVHIYEKVGKEYELKTTLEGKNYFGKVTNFLKEHGKKLRGGKNGWREYYEIDKGLLNKFLLTF